MTLKFLLDLIFPKFCFGCLKIGTYLCSSCIKKVVFTKISLCPYCEKPSPFGYTHTKCQKKLGLDGMMVIGDYTGILRTMIHYFKYKNVSSLGNSLVDLCKYQTNFYLPKLDLLIPIPLHPSRRRDRGYNQAEILTDFLAKDYDIKYDSSILIRKKSTVSQMSIKSTKLRRRNIIGAFGFNKSKIVKDQMVGIVDDVATTGATIFEAAKVLKRNGAKLVWGIVLARKLPNQYKLSLRDPA